MKTFINQLMWIFVLVPALVFAQGGVIIHGNSTLTVNGNVLITNGCGAPLTDTRDGKVYPTVMIGSQCWMAQNLNIGVILSTYDESTNNSVIEKYCWGNASGNCDIYGGLYSWDEAMQYSETEGVQGICPSGWHIPTDAEWDILANAVGGQYVAGGAMKEAGLSHWIDPNYGATNSSGFTGLPGGYRTDYAYCYNLGTFAQIWSSSKAGTSEALYRSLSYSNTQLYRSSYNYKDGFSIRCLKN
jgi:uncharacterized protein (TIGR02145 family)